MIFTPEVILINGHEWGNATNETTAERIYPLRQVLDTGGDPRRIQEIEQVNSSYD